MLSNVPSFQPVRPLFVGAHIRVIAPASPFDRDLFERGVRRLATRYRVTYDDAGIFERNAFLAGSDQRRAEELRTALCDDAVDAIVCARGGYGCTRLLERLTPDDVAAHPKLLCGFSDVTALHALFCRAGVRSLHGPMVVSLGRDTKADDSEDPRWLRWVALAEGECPPPARALRVLTAGQGTGQGPLLGGNLAVLTALCGTPHMPDLRGAVLFLEDVGEAPYRIDRMLTTLRQAGHLDELAGLVLGAFTAGGEEDPTPVLKERLDMGVPVLAGFPAGHIRENRPLPLGAHVRLNAERASLDFLEAIGPA